MKSAEAEPLRAVKGVSIAHSGLKLNELTAKDLETINCGRQDSARDRETERRQCIHTCADIHAHTSTVAHTKTARSRAVDALAVQVAGLVERYRWQVEHLLRIPTLQQLRAVPAQNSSVCRYGARAGHIASRDSERDLAANLLDLVEVVVKDDVMGLRSAEDISRWGDHNARNHACERTGATVRRKTDDGVHGTTILEELRAASHLNTSATADDADVSSASAPVGVASLNLPTRGTSNIAQSAGRSTLQQCGEKVKLENAKARSRDKVLANSR